MSNKSIQQVFSSQVIYFSLFPLALVVVIVCCLFMKEGVDATKQTALWQARSVAIEMRQKLESIKHESLRHSEIEFLEYSPIKTGMASPTLKHLQAMVLQNDLLTAAMVIDLDGNVSEAYPFPWFSAPSHSWQSILRSNTYDDRSATNAELFYLDFSSSSKNPTENVNPKYQRQIAEGPFLAVVSPLIIKQNSFAQPYAKTGYLVYLCSLKPLVNASLKTDVDIGRIKNIDVLLGDKNIYSLGNPKKSVDFKGSSVVESLNTAASSVKSDLIIQSKNSLFDHLAAAYMTFIFIMLIFFAVAYVLLMHSRRIKVQLDEPLKSIVKDCELIAQGNNAFGRKIYPFSEFQSIHDALEKMSITIEKQLDSIMEEKDKAKNSELVKSQFLANMSHEIRTPINGIIGMLTLVEKTSLNNEQQRKISLAQKSAKSLIGLINDILDFSKIEAEKMELEYIEFNMLEMLDSIIEIMNLKARAKGVELHLDTHKMKVCTAVGDEGRIRQILLNIIGNAIKFTEKGGVRVIISYYVDHQNKGLFVCEIRDTGVGMDNEQLALIFNNFVQADSSTTRKFGGTGLGLAISKKLTELMNGNITVSSEPGRGTRFTLEIPLEPGGDAYPVNSSVHPAEAYGSLDKKTLGIYRNTKILLVEDNDINQEVVKGLLEDVDLHVEVASDGLQALNKLKSSDNFALILMDCQMPVLDGFQTAQAIRAGSAGDAHKKTPIVALTANAFVQDKQKCLDAGMDDYLSKPVDEQVLLEKIFKYLDIGKSKWAGPETPPMSSVVETDTDGINIKNNIQLERWDKISAMKRVNNRSVRLNRLLEMFMDGTPTRMQALTYALDKNDYAEVKLIAHSIKGIAANLGANILMHIAGQLESAVKEGNFDNLAKWLQKLERENSALVMVFAQELKNMAMERAGPPDDEYKDEIQKHNNTVDGSS